MRARPAIVGLVVLVPTLLASGCATESFPYSDPDLRPTGLVTPAVDAAPSGPVAPRANEPFTLRPYAGMARSDPRLPALLARLREAGARALLEAEDEAGLGFVPGRTPLVELSDKLGDSPGVRVTTRVVDGIRRPVVTLATRPFLGDELTPEEHGAAALAEAALLATFGEREPPEWLRVGVPVSLAGGLPRLLHERALAQRVTLLDQLVPRLDETDPVTASMRVETLRRIGWGERPLSLLLAEFVRGATHREALAAIGVEDPLFLESAFETDRKKAFESVLANPATRAAVAARVLLDGKDPAAAGTVLAGLTRQDEEAASRWVRAELDLLRGQMCLQERRPKDALAALDRALARPTDVLRLDDARALRAAAAKASGPAAPASSTRKRGTPAPKPPVQTAEDPPPPPKPR